MEQPRREGNQELVIMQVSMVRKNDSRVLDEILMMDHSAVDTRQVDEKKKRHLKM